MDVELRILGSEKRSAEGQLPLSSLSLSHCLTISVLGFLEWYISAAIGTFF